MRFSKFAATALAGVALAGFMPAAANADAVSDFYKGRNITIFVGLSPGGLYSTWAQIFAKHFGKHVPGNPTVIVKHMPGAGGQKALNYVYNAAPKDGTAIITPNSGVARNVILKRGNPRYDPTKFRWLGGWGEPSTVLSLLKHLTPVRSLKDATKQQVILGAISKSSITYLLPAMYNNLLGTKFKIIAGYKGGSKVRLAMEKGEVQGWSGQLAGWVSRKPEWLRDDKLVHLVQLSSTRSPILPNTPLLSELAKNDTQKEMFNFLQSGKGDRATALPPGVPADRAMALEKAYQATIRDAAFQADAKKRKFKTDPLTAAEVLDSMKQALAMKPATLAALKKALGGK